jgi:hypothetical protein
MKPHAIDIEKLSGRRVIPFGLSREMPVHQGGCDN